MSHNKLLRVTQLDAVYLNNELTNIFLKQMQTCLRYLPVGLHINYHNEINHLVKLLLSSYSLFSHDCTFGQKMLLIKYSNATPLKKCLYVLLSSLDYVRDKIEDTGRNSSIIKCSKHACSVIKILSFINLCLFIKYGRYPQLVERILGLEQVYSRNVIRRQFGSKYLARELLWNGFIEVLVCVLPLINYHKIMRISRSFITFHKDKRGGEDFNVQFTISTKCAFCGEIPILPHHMDCSHVFCYVCLKGNLQADSGFECPKCGHKNSKEICKKVVM
ncbi:peroxisome biogenesis factor 2 [Agrilus planipennis]|uniref:Peroxisome biogenesis factor 2 n=1 Tax=Agrilus planipennis TaxID=224129 RepID=A0A1W4WEB8_AGRPL|nr:peroxisome biogenesis factor 2 [Agrilus planipennis]